ncbi:MAG: hypothetical protein ACR2MW_05590 [Chthoniobacterales bacterium]
MRFWRLWLTLLAEFLLLAALQFFDDWRYETMPIKFVQIAVLSGIAFYGAASEFLQLSPGRRTTIIFWSVAVLLRLVALPLEPGDDVWRYQWEGKVHNAGFNPYVLAPDDKRLAPLRPQFADWVRINHRDYASIYPPGAQLAFAVMDRVGAGALGYKLLLAAVDLAAVVVLLRLIGGSARHAAAAWYAWNPLVVYCFAGAAHFDSLMILPMLAAILCFVKCRSETTATAQWRWAILGAVAMGVAISLKLIPALLLPLCVCALGRRAWALLVSLLIPLLLSLPFGFPQVRIWDSLGKFVYVARLNDMFWWVIEDTIWPNVHQVNYSYNRSILSAVVIVSLCFWRNWKRGLLWVMGTALILSPVLHPWYLTWILPLAAWRRAVAWQVLSITMFAYYLFWDERLFPLPWHSPLWLRGFILIPPLLALLVDWQRGMRPDHDLMAPAVTPG